VLYYVVIIIINVLGVNSGGLLVWMSQNTAIINSIFIDYVLPLYIISFFLSLQSLLSSFLVHSYIMATPKKYLIDFYSKNLKIISCAGWLMVPSIMSLGAALICHVGAIFGMKSAIIAFCCYASLGIITTYQLVSIGFRHSRNKIKSEEDKLNNK
jgi:hypothetical protein